MRMGMRRFTHLTNGFSKSAENHVYAMATYFMHYNFVRIHQTLRVTPAMAAGVTEKLWDLSDMAKLLEKEAPATRGRTRRKSAERPLCMTLFAGTNVVFWVPPENKENVLYSKAVESLFSCHPKPPVSFERLRS
jgi:hypothetical protein